MANLLHRRANEVQKKNWFFLDWLSAIMYGYVYLNCTYTAWLCVCSPEHLNDYTFRIIVPVNKLEDFLAGPSDLSHDSIL